MLPKRYWFNTKQEAELGMDELLMHGATWVEGPIPTGDRYMVVVRDTR